jgi:hypothetical protein
MNIKRLLFNGLNIFLFCFYYNDSFFLTQALLSIKICSFASGTLEMEDEDLIENKS